MLGIIGIILAILFLMIGSYKGLSALPLTLLAALIVVLTNGMGLWESFSSLYMDGYVGTYLNYFLIFCCSALYAHVMTESGSTLSIAYKLLGWFGKKRGDSCLHHHRCDPDLWRSEPVCRDVCSGPDPVHHVPGSGSSQTSDRGGPVCRVLHLHYDLPAGQPAADQYHPISVSRHAADGCARVRLHCGCGNVSDGLCILPVLRGPRQKKRGALVLPEGLRRFEIPDQ